jgi:hypothetical protein
MRYMLSSVALILVAQILGCHHCEQTLVSSPEICLPSTAKAGAPLLLEAEDKCSSCNTTDMTCGVVRTSSQLDVTISASRCTDDSTCPAVCIERKTMCAFPGLPDGDYLVVVNNQAPRTLAARQDGQSGCILP